MVGVAEACGGRIDNDEFDFSNVMAEPVAAQCSAVWCSAKLAADGHARVGRNLDFTTLTVSELLGEAPPSGEQPALSRPYVIEMHPDVGSSSLGTAIGDLTGCLDGINDRGLTVALLADDETPSLRPSGMPQAGLNEMHVLRFLLDACSSAEEAKEALYGAKQYDEWAVAHYLIADDEQAFVWERDTHNAEHIVSMDGETLSVTNFLLFREGVSSIPEDLPKNTQAHDAYRRARVLREALDDQPMTGDRLWDVLESVRADARRDEVVPVARVRTLWHSQYDVEGRSVDYEFYLGDGQEDTVRRSPRVSFSLPNGAS